MADAMPGQEPQRRSVQYGYGFGAAAPSKNLPFPAHANLTAIELLTFLPHSIRCADVIYRLIANGGTRHTIYVIVNTQRNLEVEWSLSCCGSIMYRAMHEAGYADWTVRIHYRWHNARKTTWDGTSLDVAGFRTPNQMSRIQVPVADVPFKNLATGVRQIPQGEDALDLTRMVRYCMERPHEQWLYPRDYDTLLFILGGQATIRKGNIDREVFKRWAEIILPGPQNTLSRKTLPSGNKPMKQKRKKVLGLGNETVASEMQSNEKSSALIQHDRAGNSRVKPRRSGGVEQEADQQMNSNKDHLPVQPYIRAPAEYRAPPTNATQPPDSATTLHSLTEGLSDKDNPSSPYAFGGPRTAQPYRPLNHIEQPHPKDTSGWAENLRWAYEQRACFGLGSRASAWDESPEHMEIIAQIRKDQVWASDELVDRICEEQYQEWLVERRRSV